MARPGTGCASERRRRTADLHSTKQNLGMGSADERGTHDRAAYVVATWTDAAGFLAGRNKENFMAIASSNQIAPEAVTSPWHGFKGGLWHKEIEVRDLIQKNYKPYEGDESFLEPATERTKKIWDRLNELFVEERKKGV